MPGTNALVGAQFVDARRNTNSTDFLSGDYSTVAILDSELTTANAAYYTAARLATMTVNDKVFALRSEVDSAGFVPGGVIVSPAVAPAPQPLAAPAAKKK